MYKFLILIHLLYSSARFEHYYAHLSEDNCINTASGIVTLFRWLFSTKVTRGVTWFILYRMAVFSSIQTLNCCHLLLFWCRLVLVVSSYMFCWTRWLLVYFERPEENLTYIIISGTLAEIRVFIRLFLINYYSLVVRMPFKCVNDKQGRMYRGTGKSLARPGRKKANVSVRMAWISFGALSCRKKTRWQLASWCCWNRARPLHASEVASFLVGLRTYQHPGNKETVVFYFNILRILQHLLAVAERSVANTVRITIFEVRAKCLLDKCGQWSEYRLQVTIRRLPNTQVRRVTAMLTCLIPKTQTKSARPPIIQSAIDLRVEKGVGQQTLSVNMSYSIKHHATSSKTMKLPRGRHAGLII